MYQYTNDNNIRRISDGALIPSDNSNKDYKEYQKWVSSGGVTIPKIEKPTSEIWEEIKHERDLRKQAGVKVGSNWFHSDDSSRIQQLGLVMMGANIPANLQWKTMSGEFVTMTPILAGQIFQAVALSDIAIFTAAQLHKTQMEASSTPETYNYKNGWPINFFDEI